jgi:hypothetical protein
LLDDQLGRQADEHRPADQVPTAAPAPDQLQRDDRDTGMQEADRPP